jgi:tetratricopeptide (TPR) repeat protein
MADEKQEIEFYERQLANARESGDRDGEVTALGILGAAYTRLSHHEDALRCYDQALELDPRHAVSWTKKGYSLNNLDRQEEALRCFDQVVELYPRDADAWCTKGKNLKRLGRQEEAIYCFDKALELNPRDSFCWYCKGISLTRLHRHEDALCCYDKALELDPRLTFVWSEKGVCLVSLGRYEDAIDSFSQSLKFHPRNERAWYGKAKAEDLLGRRNDAVQSYKQYLALPRAIQKIQDIEFARQRIKELESDHTLSVNKQENKVNSDSKPDRNITDLPAGAAYKKGDFIGQKYEVYGVLGKGGFGVVYLVYSHETGWVYALKTFRDEFLADQEVRKRFHKEASVWVELGQNPYLVRAYLVEEISGRLYIAMEYIAPNDEGLNSLEGYLQRRPPDLAQSLRWAIQVCHGMEHAYSKGVVSHRDLKPANIMISQDQTARITDFGLASVLGTSLVKPGIRLNTRKDGIAASGQTQEGGGFGTKTHMPPEQFRKDSRCDERSDIYAFGVVLFQMASRGRLPFMAPLPKDDSELERLRFGLAMQRLHSESPVPQLDSPLFSIIQNCLEKPPEKRYQTFKELRIDLELLLRCKTGEVIYPPQSNELAGWEWINKGISLNSLGHHEEAILCFDRVLEFDPHNIFAWNNKGAGLGRQGRHEEAIHCFDQALELDPRTAATWNNKGNSLDGLDRHEEAIHCYDQALEFDSNDAGTWNNKGTSLDSLGCYEEAIRCFDKALELDPRYVAPWNNKGNSLNNLGRYEEAIRCLDKALELDPLNVDSWTNKGNNFVGLGSNEDALRCYDQALELDPHHVAALYNKGSSLDCLSHFDEAIRYYDQALELNPCHVNAWNNKGNSLNSLGRYEEAIHCFDKALEFNPRYVNAWTNKGVNLHILGRYEEAIRSFDQALELDPRDVSAWISKALAEDQLNHWREASRSYHQFLELAPTLNPKLIEYARRRMREIGGK